MESIKQQFDDIMRFNEMEYIDPVENAANDPHLRLMWGCMLGIIETGKDPDDYHVIAAWVQDKYSLTDEETDRALNLCEDKLCEEANNGN